MKKLKILIIPYIVPFPTTDGGKVCTFGFIDSLRNSCDFTIIFEANSQEDVNNIAQLKKIWTEVKIDFITNFTEEKANTENPLLKLLKKNTNNFFIKVLNLIHKIQLYLKLTPPIITQKTSNNPFLYIERTTPFYPTNMLLVEKISTHFKTSKFDIVQTDYLPNITLVEMFPSNVKSVFVLIESRFNILKDYAQANNLNTSYYDYVVKNTKKLEHYYMGKYDAIFTLNQKDKDNLTNALPKIKIFNSPFGVLNNEIIENIKPVLKYQKLILLGSDNHYPNLDSLEWYINEIMPILIPKLNINLHVIGNWSVNTRKKYKNYPNICFEGFVQNLEQSMQNSILIVPIRIGGGGIRTKILSAMAIGVPVISTDLAAVGITAGYEPVLLEANTASEFVDKIIYLHKNPNEGNKLTSAAHLLIKQKYSQSYTSSLRESYYHEIASVL